MPRVNVWLPQDVYDTLRRELPDVNVSKLLRAAIEKTLDCWHDQLACTRCGSAVDHKYLISLEITRFYADARWALGQLTLTGTGTSEGAERVLKEVAAVWHGKGLLHRDAYLAPVHRPPRSTRDAVMLRAQDMPKTPHQLAEEAADAARRAEIEEIA